MRCKRSDPYLDCYIHEPPGVVVSDNRPLALVLRYCRAEKQKPRVRDRAAASHSLLEPLKLDDVGARQRTAAGAGNPRKP